MDITMKYLLFCLCLLLSLPLAHAQSVEFKIATLAPDGSSWMSAMRAGAETIDQRTDGRVSFRFYPGGIMGNDRSVLRRIRVGQLHGGAITGGGLAEVLPESQVYSLPFLFRDYAEVDAVRTHIDPVLSAALQDKGFVSFGIIEGGFAYLLSNTPIRRMGDLSGHKIWIPEGDVLSRGAFEASGITPIPLPLTDVLTGLQTGLINTVAGSPTGVIALQWHTRTAYLTETPLMYLFGSMIIQRRAFQRISPADQLVVKEVMEAIFRELDRGIREDNQKAMAALQQQGIQFVQTDLEDITQWLQLIEQNNDKLIAAGLFDRKILDQLRQHLTAQRQRNPVQ
jgi:TRAP-type C4-dicarboxylate transport system substrate-binding protein